MVNDIILKLLWENIFLIKKKSSLENILAAELIFSYLMILSS